MFQRLSGFAILTIALGTAGRADTEIVLQNGFIDHCKDRVTIDANYVVDKALKHVHAAKDDGDIHIAGRADEVKLPCVAEIMNAKDETEAVALVHEKEGTGQTVSMSGLWRIWCEHGGDSLQVQGTPLEPFDTTNPPHVFEIHPVTELNGKSLLGSLRDIPGYETYSADHAFQVYENIYSQITVGDGTTTIHTRLAGCNYVEFGLRPLEKGMVVDDGRFQFAEVCDLDGEPIVHKRRMVFAKDSDPEVKTRNLPDGAIVHVLGIPRIDLATVAWRCKHATATGNKEVLDWSLPYEIMVVGYYGLIEEGHAEPVEHHARTVTARAGFIPADVPRDDARAVMFEGSEAH
jgi:hypothetical protein